MTDEEIRLLYTECRLAGMRMCLGCLCPLLDHVDTHCTPCARLEEEECPCQRHRQILGLANIATWAKA